MKFKKALSIFLTTILAASVLVGCSTPAKSDEVPTSQEQQVEDSVNEAKYADGLYYAAGEFGSEWTSNVVVKVKDGKIVDAEWNALNIAGGKDKMTLAADGEYGMIKAAKAEWHEQAASTAAHLIETQDPTIIEYTDEDGRTDAISGVTIKVVDFFKVAEKALTNGPIAEGNFKDGYYYVEGEPSEKGERNMVQLVVVNGSIVDANINVLMKDKEDKDSNKKTISIAGDYGMEKVASAPAHDQLAAIEKYLIEKQDTEVNYIDESKTDSITGATISVKNYLTLVDEALNADPLYPIFK